jgi:hypothetical protein
MLPKASGTQPVKRARAPTITVDTSALSDQNGMKSPAFVFVLSVFPSIRVWHPNPKLDVIHHQNRQRSASKALIRVPYRGTWEPERSHVVADPIDQHELEP